MKKIFFIYVLFIASCTTEPEEIPDDNAVLSNLLSMGADEFEGMECAELPDSVCVWEDGRIIMINLFNMGLNGNIPNEIGNLTEITQLGLKSNNLTGGIPESIGNLINLTQLSLGDNELNDTIPEIFGNLSKLNLLDLSNNNLEGSIPLDIGNLTGLFTFLADSNNLSGSIPESLCAIEYLKISNNSFCSTQPQCIDTPDLMGYQSCDCLDSEEFISGYCYAQSDLNVLRDFILNADADSLNMNLDIDSSTTVDPLELGIQQWNSGRLNLLDCHWEADKCNLSGNLPISIGTLDSLEYLDVKQNNLTGEIPEGITHLTGLKYLNLSDNELSGNLPDNLCSELAEIEDILVSNNNICPCYPDCIDNVGSQSISECESCGEGFTIYCDDLPETLSILEGDSLCFNESNMETLQAFIDSSLTTLPDSLDISMDADSSGRIEPLELGNQVWANGKIISLIANNRGISGGLPDNINNLDSLGLLILSDNHLSGELPINLYSLLSLSSIHLSGNNLSGEILVGLCFLVDNWDLNGFSQIKSYIDNNNFCPGETGYPACIEPYLGEQDITNCTESDSP